MLSKSLPWVFKIGLLRRIGRQLSSTVVRDLYAFSIRPGIDIWQQLSGVASDPQMLHA